MAAYGGYAVRVSGLQPLVRGFGRVNKQARRDLQFELRRIAVEVRDLARDEARAQGLVDTGNLVRNIRYSARGGTALIRETADRRGYFYPYLYEYGGAGVRGNRHGTHRITNRTSLGSRLAAFGPAQGLNGELGPRAFMGPTAIKAQPLVERRLETMLDRLLSEAGLSGGGTYGSGGDTVSYAPTGGIL